MEYERRTLRFLNLLGNTKQPWTCSLHHVDCPATSDGCPECVAEWEAHHGRPLHPAIVREIGAMNAGD